MMLGTATSQYCIGGSRPAYDDGDPLKDESGWPVSTGGWGDEHGCVVGRQAQAAKEDWMCIDSGEQGVRHGWELLVNAEPDVKGKRLCREINGWRWPNPRIGGRPSEIFDPRADA